MAKFLIKYLDLRKNPSKPDQPNWKINERIRAEKVRVLSSEGKQVGVLNIKDAIQIARTEGKDLVEISPFANPPVVKIVELGKFKYEQEKKARKMKKAKSGEMKEIRFSPFMGEADYAMRLKRINAFLKERYKIKAVVKFKGRQMGSKSHGYKLLERLIDDVDHNIVIDMEPKFMGRHLAMVISPSNKKTDEKPKLKAPRFDTDTL